MEDHHQVFKEEAHELLAELETSLIELENNHDDFELINQVFRCMHTIKGSSAMFGFDKVSEFTHEIENVYDMIRDGRAEISRTLIDMSLKAGDLIRAMVEGESVDDAEERRIVRYFQDQLLSAAKVPHISVEAYDALPGSEPETGEELTDETLYRIRFKPHRDIFESGTNPIYLLEELRSMGACRLIINQSAIPELKNLDPESCYFNWDIFLYSLQDRNAVRDVFLFVEDRCHISIKVLDGGNSADFWAKDKKIGEILVDRGDVSPDEIEKVLVGKKRVGELLVEAKIIDPDTLESALVEQEQIREAGRRRMALGVSTSLRVSAEKLDTLVDLVGELVTVQARLTRKAVIDQDSELTSISEEVERLSAELRDNTMNIRMLPVGSTFRKFRRLIFDLSNELGKEVGVFTEGEETELDKTVLEQLNDPLMHIIRNAIDHGIETPDERAALGKPRQGTIALSAEHSGSSVKIRISDDGGGIDLPRIREKAVDKGLIPPHADPEDRELYALLCTPGFSTAKQVTGVSGRGVGMDVVKRRVEAFRGTVEIESETGRGTTVILKLPLTLAIADGLLVKVGDGHYVLPLMSVEECLELNRKEADKARERNIINFREKMISYISMRDMFKEEGEKPGVEKVVIVETGQRRVGLGVDTVVGQHQTVIKSLGKFYQDIKAMSGATILGDGTVALILDVEQIVQSMETVAA